MSSVSIDEVAVASPEIKDYVVVFLSNQEPAWSEWNGRLRFAEITSLHARLTPTLQWPIFRRSVVAAFQRSLTFSPQPHLVAPETGCKFKTLLKVLVKVT